MVRSKKSLYVCQTCGFESTGWLGKCTECGTWGSLVETLVSTGQRSENKGHSKASRNVTSLFSVIAKRSKRMSTKISELDRVLGGGIVAGQVILIAGEPGIGKSTILMQLADKLARPQRLASRSQKTSSTTRKAGDGGRGNVLYVSGEESAHQIALRAKRLGVTKKTINVAEETNLDLVIATSNELISKGQGLKAIIIDSIQTMTTNDLRGMSGSAGQVRECSTRLVRFAKQTHIPIIIVGHVTKIGSVAGPALLMHIVDTVLWFEGSRDLSFRLLRARKNRFGPTDEVGIFTMGEKGLISIDDTSGLFLSEGKSLIPGSCVTSIMEGTRPILVEVQSLIVPTKMAFPKRVAQGIDAKKLELLLAVLQRRAGIPVADYDVFVNIVGGIRISEPGVDLAVCLSIASSHFNKSLPKKLVAIGEVGLLGEVRGVVAQEKRVKEAKRLGFKQVVTGGDIGYVKEIVRKFFK